MRLEIKNLSVAYDKEAVISDLSLMVEKGEFISLLGPSGCGKTTLMKSIAGILPAKSGTIHLGGNDITGSAISKRGTVIVFQDMRLFPHQSVAENVAFPLKMQGVSKSERLKIAEELLKKVHMEGYGKRLPSELSGGQQQRIALARALAAKPKLLLLDEPFSALDENLREDMRNLVLELKQEFGMTAILVTHDREEALSMSDRVVVMFEGQIFQEGVPKEVYNHPSNRRVADYFGDCTYLTGNVENGVFTGGGISYKTDSPNGKYQLMIRPNDFHPEQYGDYDVTVESVKFRGGDTLVTFRAGDNTVWKKAFSRTPKWNVGDKLSVMVSTENAVLFEID